MFIGIMVCVLAVKALMSTPNEGTINYEVKVNLHRTVPSDRPEMKDMLPEFDTYHDRLVFRDGEFLYKTVEEEEGEEFSGSDGTFRMRIRRPPIEYYGNQTTSQRIRAQELFGKRYLIEDSVRILPWQLGPETQTILGYTCKEASWYNEKRKQQVKVWYTEQLRPFLGPEIYNSLPGTVLLVDINDGERTITAKNVDLSPLKKNALKAPATGQRVTEEEFDKIREEQIKKMGAQGGNMIFRRN